MGYVWIVFFWIDLVLAIAKGEWHELINDVMVMQFLFAALHMASERP